MMMNNKKIAMMIVRGLADFDDSKESDPTKEQSMKTPEEHKKSDDSRMGPELAMEKFISAVHDRDSKKAMTAMMEFMEMSEGMEYCQDDVEGSMHEGSSEPKED